MKKTTSKPKGKKSNAPVKKRAIPKPLTVQQQRFCEFIAAGESQTEAWLKAGYKVSRAVAAVNANEALRNPKIQDHLTKLRTAETAAITLTRDRKRILLHQIAENASAPWDARLRAIAEDSKMQGHYEPEKQQIDHRVSNLDEIRKRALEAISPFAIPIE